METPVEDLLRPRHPLDGPHQQQLAALRQLLAPQRGELARLFRLGNATYRYQQQAAGAVTEDDYQHWLAGLPPRMQAAMTRAGYAACRTSLALRRHALERRDVGYAAFMQSVLSAEDWAFEQ